MSQAIRSVHKELSQRFARFRASVLLISASNFVNCCKHLTIGFVYTSMHIFEKIILTRMPKNNKITCVRGFPLQISGTRIVPRNSQSSVENASLHACLPSHTSRWLKQKIPLTYCWILVEQQPKPKRIVTASCKTS